MHVDRAPHVTTALDLAPLARRSASDGGSESMSLGSRRLCNDLPQHSSNSADFVARIEWNRAVIYVAPGRSKDRRPPPAHTRDNLTRGIYNGYISPATRRMIKSRVSPWIRSIWLYRKYLKRRWDPGRAYPVAVTLTLPSDQIHDDKTITRRILTPYLQHLKRAHGIEHYFWRAEAQESGRLHYHLIVDRFIKAEDLTTSWNLACNRLGYVDRYYEATGSATPPSTEIHRLRDKVPDPKTGKMRDVDPVDYLLDYLTEAPQIDSSDYYSSCLEGRPTRLIGRYRKPDGSYAEYVTRPVSGRTWGMDDGLRTVRPPTGTPGPRIFRALTKAVDQQRLRRIVCDYATLYFGRVCTTLMDLDKHLGRHVFGWYVQIFRELYPGQLPPHVERSRIWHALDHLWSDLELLIYQRDPAHTTPHPSITYDYTNDPQFCYATVNGQPRIFLNPIWADAHGPPDDLVSVPPLIY